MNAKVTDAFVQAFRSEADYHDAFANLVATGVLPLGVVKDDPRVKDIVLRCQKARNENLNHR